jgi:hypothetical protein
MDFKEMGCEDVSRIEQAYDKIRWWATLMRVMNLWASPDHPDKYQLLLNEATGL